MTKEDITKIMIIIALALLYRNDCDGVVNQYEELRREVGEILTNHFRVIITSDDDDSNSQVLTDTNIRQADIKSEVENC